MSAGTGVVHSERNREDNTLKLFQIWISSRTRGLDPRYDQRSFDVLKKNKIELLVSGNEDDDALYINQDAYVSRVVLDGGREVEYLLKHLENGVYIFVIKGSVYVAGHELSDRDALGVTNLEKITLSAKDDTEILIFEVPMQ